MKFEPNPLDYFIVQALSPESLPIIFGYYLAAQGILAPCTTLRINYGMDAEGPEYFKTFTKSGRVFSNPDFKATCRTVSALYKAESDVLDNRRFREETRNLNIFDEVVDFYSGDVWK